ncbi:glycosyltransferase [Halovivax limisalsi]|uniref:glycosyltransferase n=1 Tax=Halovivax limisalsi TaxID=1453760 RepID=UPI001FFD5CC5|nr:glycosyltransferase [Halovivax limisalsi]
MTRVSIVIPTYNRAETLPRAIESAFAQTCDDVEVVIVDDGSTDETPDRVATVADRVEAADGGPQVGTDRTETVADRLEYVRFPENRGANAARNAGIERASGTYVSFLDSDDELEPTHVERAIEVLEAAPDSCAGVYTAFRVYHDESFVDVSRARSLVTREDILAGNVIGSFSATTFRRDALRAVGGLDGDLAAAQDYDLYVRLLEEYHVRGIDEALATVYKQPDSIGFQLDAKLAGNRAIREKHGDVLTDRRLAAQYFAEGILAGRAGRRTLARDRFERALRTRPDLRTLYFYLATTLGERVFDRSYRLATGIRKGYRLLSSEIAGRRS